MYGDVRDLDRVCQAAAGMDIVVHLAAGLRGSSGFILESCIDGTKNVTEAARRGGLKRVIYMSSLSVYDYVKLRDGEVITAHSPLEEYPEQRGAYSLGKRQAEDVALSHLQDPSPAWTILRPSLIMGKGADIFSPVGVKLGNVLFCLGAAHQHLRAVHVEDVGTAILQLLQHENTRGRVFPLSAPGAVTLQDYVETYIRAGRYRNLRVVYVPYWCAALGGWALETLRKLTGKGPNLNLRRLASLYRDVRVDSSGLAEQTGWQPREGLLERLRQPGCVVVSAAGSTLRARRQADATYCRIEGADGSAESRSNVLIYVPAARGATPEQQQQDPFEAFARCGAAFGDHEGQVPGALGELNWMAERELGLSAGKASSWPALRNAWAWRRR